MGALGRGSVRINGFEVAYLEAGPADGPLALCLHGFPDVALTWRDLLPRLADAGYHAVAPWMRGYHPTEVPPGRHFEPGALGADAAALHDRLGGGEPGVLIGHDWGAVATWSAVASDPDRWRRAVAMSVPPTRAWLPRALLLPEQLRRSWYIFFFQLPWLPERTIARDDFAELFRWWTIFWPDVREEPEYRAALHAAFTAPGGLQAALGYYRWMTRPWAWSRRYWRRTLAAARPPRVPTLYLHGEQDHAVGSAWVDRSAALLPPGSRVETIAGAGHWLHLSHPDAIARHIVGFLGPARP